MHLELIHTEETRLIFCPGRNVPFKLLFTNKDSSRFRTVDKYMCKLIESITLVNSTSKIIKELDQEEIILKQIIQFYVFESCSM